MKSYFEKDDIFHYASPYYDPVKAHEYYMRRRQLKGRTTTRLSDEGKEVWDYTKSQIGEEKKSAAKSLSEERERKIQEARDKILERTEQLNAKLEQLRRNKQFYNSAGLRRKLANDLRKVIAATRKAYQESKTSLDKKYEDIYQAEYDKISFEYAKPEKKKKSRKKKQETVKEGGSE